MQISMFTSKNFLLAMIVALSCSLSACSEYWWERGQPPAVAKLLDRAQTRLNENIEKHKSDRAKTAEIAAKVEQSLITSLDSVKNEKSPAAVNTDLENVATQFMQLEGNIAVTSRAAYGELSGELRRFIQQSAKSEKVEYAPFGTFTARTLFFLADELTVPAPNFG